MLEQRGASPGLINVVVRKTAKWPDFHTIHDYVHAILHLISTEEIEPWLGADMPVPASLPTHLESERLPMPGSKHYEGVRASGPRRRRPPSPDHRVDRAGGVARRRRADAMLIILGGTGASHMHLLAEPGGTAEAMAQYMYALQRPR